MKKAAVNYHSCFFCGDLIKPKLSFFYVLIENDFQIHK